MTATAKNATKKPQEGRKASGLGLDSIGDLSGLLDHAEAATGGFGPLMLDIELIDEDPHQPREADNPGFSAESLNELAATIRLRGVKTPISVRDNTDAPGRFLLNHGARRTRASKIAGKTQIPAFVDNDYLDDDQVIENLQRDGLTPREIANHIGRKLAQGQKKGDIAKNLGKSAAFVTQHVTLLDLPEPIAEAFNTGRVKDVTVINELVTAYKKKPEEVTGWLADEDQEITRGSVKLLREFLDDKARDPNTIDAFSGKTDAEDEDGEQGPSGSDAKEKKEAKEPDPDKLKKAIVQVEHYGRPARLILSKRPSEIGLAWFKYEDDGMEFEAAITEAKLVAIVEG